MAKERYFECIPLTLTGNNPEYGFVELKSPDDYKDNTQNVFIVTEAEGYIDAWTIEAEQWWHEEGVFKMTVNECSSLGVALLIAARAAATNLEDVSHAIGYGLGGGLNVEVEYLDEKKNASNMPCPLSFLDILKAEYRDMDHNDYECFSGVEGNGEIANVQYGPTSSCTIVLSFPKVNEVPTIQVVDDDNGVVWQFGVNYVIDQLTNPTVNYKR